MQVKHIAAFTAGVFALATMNTFARAGDPDHVQARWMVNPNGFAETNDVRGFARLHRLQRGRNAGAAQKRRKVIVRQRRPQRTR